MSVCGGLIEILAALAIITDLPLVMPLGHLHSVWRIRNKEGLISDEVHGLLQPAAAFRNAACLSVRSLRHPDLEGNDVIQDRAGPHRISDSPSGISPQPRVGAEHLPWENDPSKSKLQRGFVSGGSSGSRGNRTKSRWDLNSNHGADLG